MIEVQKKNKGLRSHKFDSEKAKGMTPEIKDWGQFILVDSTKAAG